MRIKNTDIFSKSVEITGIPCEKIDKNNDRELFSRKMSNYMNFSIDAKRFLFRIVNRNGKNLVLRERN